MDTNHTALRSILLMALLYCGLCCHAQEIVVEDRYDEVFGQKPALHLAGRSDLNLDDMSAGAEVGIVNKSGNFNFFGSFDIRPFRKRVLEYAGSNLYYQYREDRFFAGVGSTYMRSFDQSRFGAFLQANINYTWGSYGGTERKPDKGLIIVPRMGLTMMLKGRKHLRFGYSFIDSKSSDFSPHRLSVGFVALFSKR